MLAAHGLVHLLGTALSWRLAQPGELRYTDLSVAPGSGPALVLGGLWALACGCFAGAAVVLLARRAAWWCLAHVGVVVSLPVIVLEVRIAVAGLVVDVLVIALLAWTRTRRRRP